MLPTWVTILVALALFVVIALFFSSLNPWNPLNYFGKPTTKVDTSRAAVVRQIQGLNRLETASYTIDKIIEAGNTGNVFQNLLYGDRILLIAHGTVVAGVDLSAISPKDVIIAGHSLRINLPPTRIFSTTLDANQTRVYDRRLGLLSKGDKDLETQARAAATSSITSAACTDGILQRAATEAKARLSQMYALLGFSPITIDAPVGNC